jgi:glycosyltransferase involved in cell wall biosynthesis
MVCNERLVSRIYAAADLFVSASASETFGFTVVEAMACGTPAVVVNAGAFRTVYAPLRERGWTFEEGDAAGYVRAVCSLLYERERATEDAAPGPRPAPGGPRLAEARQASRDLAVREWSVESSVADVLRAYQFLVDLNAPPRTSSAAAAAEEEDAPLHPPVPSAVGKSAAGPLL